MALNKRTHKKFIKNKDIFKTATAARKRARKLGLRGIHSHGRGKAKRFMPGSSHPVYERALRKKNGKNR
jgi:hypothetical protein|tara:strand:- start:628 stop:834 length:207 start_codon:yes stop_codon:yes gene_type:complete